MLTAIIIVIAAILSIQVVDVHSATVERCLGGIHHKQFPSPGGPGFATCFPWKKKACCSAELTENLKEHGIWDLIHVDWDYCGNVSEECRKYLTKHACLYFCDPNMFKWQTCSGCISKVPICSDTCDKWFDACKNDKTYSSNWLDEYVLYRYQKGPVKSGQTCKTFAEIFKNGEGMCNKIFGKSFAYERSSNCMVFDFKGKNPNDKVVPLP